MFEGERGSYKLSNVGKKYAQALDWGKLAEANLILKDTLKNNTLTKKAIAYVEINQPVTKDDLESQIALISQKPKADRWITGIKGFVDMLFTSGLLQSDSNGNITATKEKREETAEVSIPPSYTVPPTNRPIPSLPITLSINVDEKTDVGKLKEVLQAIKAIFSE
jgi:hypothetical protein